MRYPQSGLKKVWEGWKAIAKRIGDFNARLILTLFYFLIVGFFSLLVGRWQNYLRKRLPPDTNWLPVEKKDATLLEAKRQY